MILEPTEVMIKSPSGISSSDVPDGFHWLNKPNNSNYTDIFFKADGRIRWLIRRYTDDKRLSCWVCQPDFVPTGYPSYEEFLPKYLGDFYNVIKIANLLDELLTHHDAPYADWLLFNLDWLSQKEQL